MEDQYGMTSTDLRHYINSRPLFPPPPDLLSANRGAALNPYDMLIFRSDSTTSVTTNAAASSSAAAFGGSFDNGGGDGGTGRWPRQETLTLLEIRSRLDPKFKEANQKGPLWDEVSRIMSEEHGYQRSGKKCREKFENLYKYYKKTKEGKAGRQDGKHYRFFRQLEALYGEANPNPSSMSENHLLGGNNLHSNYPNKNTLLARNQDTSLSLSNYSEADTSSSDDSDFNEGKGKRRSSKPGWKVKIRDFIDAQMKKLMDKQEAWMEKMMRSIEDKERERAMREEEWRKQEAARIEREHKFWATERQWIEARDAALMEALHKLSRKETNDDIWPECEMERMIQLRNAMEVRFQQRGVSEEALWEEIATKMACFGHERSGVVCREKWDTVNNYLLKCSKKRKESSKGYFQSNESTSNPGGGVYCDVASDHQNMSRLSDHANSSPNAANNAMSESCFRYFMGDGYGRIMN